MSAGEIDEEAVREAAGRLSPGSTPDGAGELTETDESALTGAHGVPGSLRARGRERLEELENRTTELFAVPRFGNIIAVELKAISWAKTEAFVTKNQRHVTNAMLATAGDEIEAATVDFYLVKDDGETLDRIEPHLSWADVAAEFGREIAQVPNRERVAMVALCSDQGVIGLNGQYRQWLGGEDTGLSNVVREIRRDF